MSNIQFNDILEIFNSNKLSSEIHQNLLYYKSNNPHKNFIKIILIEFYIDINSNNMIKEEKELWLKNKNFLFKNFFSKFINEILQNCSPSLKNYLEHIISILLHFQYEKLLIFLIQYQNLLKVYLMFLKKQKMSLIKR